MITLEDFFLLSLLSKETDRLLLRYNNKKKEIVKTIYQEIGRKKRLLISVFF
jgi:hypothetical protein